MRDSTALLPLLLCALFLSLGALPGCSGSSEENSASQAKDVLLVAEVKSKLAAIDVDTASNVSVSVNDGIVVLHGVVRKASEIQRLNDAAASVRGVTSVRTLITADSQARGVSEKLGDVSLETQVAVSLAAQTGVNALGVKTRAVNGVVTLEGHVPSAELKSVMWNTVAKTRGVKKVVDKIEIVK